MSTSLNGRLDEHAKILLATSGLLLTSTVGDTTYVSLKNYRKLTIIVSIADGTTVTGSTITLKQATTVAGASEKALAFTRMLANVDYASSATMVETAVTSNTFTTQTTNSLNSLYIIEVNAEDLDVANGFDCVQLSIPDTGAAGAQLLTALYILSEPRYAGAGLQSAIVD